MDPNASIWENCLETAALSDIGLRRGNNQDSMAVALAASQEKWETRGHLFMVADGMGAHAAGELASKVAADTIPLAYNKLLDQPAPNALRSAVLDANAQIHSRGSASDDFRGMGTTVTVLVLLPQGAVVGHVGDSRAYRVRGNRIQQLTFDHSLVWELRAAGQIPSGDVPNYIPKNIITRSLGPNAEVQVDLEGPFPLEVGDTFLLCSDGLSGQMKDEEIGKILTAIPPKEAVRFLVDLANLRGGPDNITVVVVRINGPQAAEKTGGTSENVEVTKNGQHAPNPIIWWILGTFVLIALVLSSAGFVWAALGSLAAALVTGLVALVRYYGSAGDLEFSERPLGKGPYTVSECTSDPAFVGELAKVAEQLRDAASSAEWTVNWKDFRGHVSHAAAAAKGENYLEAVREYCRGISSLMNQLRHQRGHGMH